MAIVHEGEKDRWANSIRMPIEEGKKLDALAKKLGCAVSQLIRAGLARVMAKHPTADELKAAFIPSGRMKTAKKIAALKAKKKPAKPAKAAKPSQAKSPRKRREPVPGALVAPFLDDKAKPQKAKTTTSKPAAKKSPKPTKRPAKPKAEAMPTAPQQYLNS